MVVDTLANDTVSLERWGPFVIPDTGTFQASEVGAIWTTNPLQWVMSLNQQGEMFQLDVKPLTADAVGEFMLEAIAAQALMAIPGMAFEQAIPLEAVGRIVTVDFDPHTPPAPAPAPRPNREPRYADGDPPVPMLILTGIDHKVEHAYYGAVCNFLRSGDISQFNGILHAVLNKFAGHMSRAEVFYFLVRVQSLLTGAYKQRYLQHQVIPAEVGHIVG